jgi:hypothetical protein
MGDKLPSICSKALETALERIRLAESRIIALHYAYDGIPRYKRERGVARSDFHELNAELYQEVNEAYRALLMWAIIIPDEMQTRVRKMVMDKYLKNTSSIMGYLELDGQPPSMWSGTDEEAFRAELAQFMEKQTDGELEHYERCAR